MNVVTVKIKKKTKQYFKKVGLEVSNYNNFPIVLAVITKGEKNK